MCAGAGRRSKFRRKVPEAVPASSGVCWCRFWRQVPEAGSGFPVQNGVGPVRVGVGSGGRVRKGSEKVSGGCWCRFRRQGSEGSGGFQRVPVRGGRVRGVWRVPKFRRVLV